VRSEPTCWLCIVIIEGPSGDAQDEDRGDTRGVGEKMPAHQRPREGQRLDLKKGGGFWQVALRDEEGTVHIAGFKEMHMSRLTLQRGQIYDEIDSLLDTCGQ